MTQHSRPQQGLAPGDGVDSGAYTANQWRATLIAHNRSGGMIVTGAAAPPGLPATQVFPDVGVFYATANQLEVSSPAAAQISIDTGQAIVDGTLFDNDTAITAAAVTIPVGGANSRVDRVVVRQNYTGATYTPTYVPSLTVPANTARITVISGAEAIGPVAPTLTQDEDRATYWDIPLYQYEIIHTTGVISAEVDQRDWVDAETKRVMVPAVEGWNTTDGVALEQDTAFGLEMLDAKYSAAYGQWAIPTDYIDDLTIDFVVVPQANGNLYCFGQADYSLCSEAASTNQDDTGWQTIAVTNVRECLNRLAPASETAGDLLSLTFVRDATNINDTVAADVDVSGFLIQYLGWGRR